MIFGGTNWQSNSPREDSISVNENDLSFSTRHNQASPKTKKFIHHFIILEDTVQPKQFGQVMPWLSYVKGNQQAL